MHLRKYSERESTLTALVDAHHSPLVLEILELRPAANDHFIDNDEGKREAEIAELDSLRRLIWELISESD